MTVALKVVKYRLTFEPKLGFILGVAFQFDRWPCSLWESAFIALKIYVNFVN